MAVSQFLLSVCDQRDGVLVFSFQPPCVVLRLPFLIGQAEHLLPLVLPLLALLVLRDPLRVERSRRLCSGHSRDSKPPSCTV